MNKIFIFIAVIGVLTSIGCGDNCNASSCKSACQKLFECDAPEQGGPDVLNSLWLENCEQACEDCDVDTGEVIDCILREECETLRQVCETESELPSNGINNFWVL